MLVIGKMNEAVDTYAEELSIYSASVRDFIFWSLIIFFAFSFGLILIPYIHYSEKSYWELSEILGQVPTWLLLNNKKLLELIKK
jgi:maltodextrin utilization protein YvdJ